jgi:hypothetical protein
VNAPAALPPFPSPVPPGVFQRSYPLDLDLYEVTNLRELLYAVGGQAGKSSLSVGHTGDWTLQIAWKLDAILKDAEQPAGHKLQPNVRAADMVLNANTWKPTVSS